MHHHDFSSQGLEKLGRDGVKFANDPGVTKLDLIIAILPEHTVEIWEQIKRFGDVRGVATQCMIARNAVAPHRVLNYFDRVGRKYVFSRS